MIIMMEITSPGHPQTSWYLQTLILLLSSSTLELLLLYYKLLLYVPSSLKPSSSSKIEWIFDFLNHFVVYITLTHIDSYPQGVYTGCTVVICIDSPPRLCYIHFCFCRPSTKHCQQIILASNIIWTKPNSWLKLWLLLVKCLPFSQTWNSVKILFSF